MLLGRYAELGSDVTPGKEKGRRIPHLYEVGTLYDIAHYHPVQVLPRYTKDEY